MGARFKIKCAGSAHLAHTTIVGVPFSSGVAEIDSADGRQRAALRYFSQTAGYDIEPLSDISVDDALWFGTDPADEAKVLRREIARLKDAEQVRELREERDRLVESVAQQRAEDRMVGDPDGDGGTVVEAAQVSPPEDGAPVADWRTWVVGTGRMSEEDAKATSKGDLVARFGSEARRRDEEGGNS